MNTIAHTDTSRLEAAIAERLKYPGRTEAQAINSALYWIAVNTKNTMPAASQDEIDTSLGRYVIPRNVTTPWGQRISLKRKIVGYEKTASRTKSRKELPLAAAIIMARTKSGARIPAKWRLENPFKGKSRAAGARAMRRVVEDMLKGRHSSTHFLLTGWFGAIQALRSLVRIGKGQGGSNDSADYNYSPHGGNATPAKEGSALVMGTIWNNIGDVNEIPERGEKAQQALEKYGRAPFTEAIAREARQMEDYVKTLQKPLDDKFNQMAN